MHLMAHKGRCDLLRIPRSMSGFLISPDYGLTEVTKREPRRVIGKVILSFQFGWLWDTSNFSDIYAVGPFEPSFYNHNSSVFVFVFEICCKCQLNAQDTVEAKKM